MKDEFDSELPLWQLPPQATREPLTMREAQVLFQIVNGNTSKEAALLMGLSHRTVEAYRLHVLRKTNTRNTAALVRLALQAASAPSE